LFYTINDCWKLGGRAEWWKSNNVVAGDDISFYNIAGGVNYRAHANLVIRPEVRYDWTPAEDAVNASLGEDYNQTWFGVDAILTY
ncbi:MAG TPA: outer membrane beta-barrel protein, partial [Lacipirellulaceae bacterium]